MAYDARGPYDPSQPHNYPQQQQQQQQQQHNDYQPYVPYEVSQSAPDPRYQYAPPPYPQGFGENRGTPIPPPPGYNHSPPHILDAVNQAADKVEPVRPPETTATQLPPELLQQLTTHITETVKTQILNDLKATLPQVQDHQQYQQHQQHQHQAPPPPSSYPPQSPATSSSRPVYTPDSHDADGTDGSDEEEVEAPSRPPPRKESPEAVRKEDLAGRFGDRSVQPEERSRSRPAFPRMMTNDEVTTLEKIWQPLFTGDGQPTARLSQFLRGLALHLVEDYEPQKSLVIPPHKMQRFYEEVNIGNEPYPWRDLFTKLPHTTLSRIYRSLGCAHHFIQSNVRNEPTVPALTPEGFCTWLTLLIQAHPDTEFSRLAFAVRDMPISNADDRKERFPKELSRRLFPKYYDSKVRDRCNVALNPPPPQSTQPYVPAPPSGPPPGTAPRDIPERPREQSIPASVASLPAVGSFSERERAPYGSTASNAAPERFHDRSSRTDGFRLGSDATDGGSGSVMSEPATYSGTSPPERAFSIPIERERKPYIAKEGKGKIYEAGASNTAASSNATLRPDNAQSSIEGEAMRSRRRSNSQTANMQPPFKPSRGGPAPVSGLSAGLGRSDTRRNRSPSGSVSSNGFAPPVLGTGSQIYSGSEDDSQAREARRRERDRETEDERRERKERERRREKEKEREREEDDEERRSRRKEKEREERKDREKSRRRDKDRDSDEEYNERRGDRDRDHDREREREKEQERRKKEDERLERDRERAAAEYRRAAEERERYEDDGRSAYSEPSTHHHHRRPTNPGSNGYGPVPGSYVPPPPLSGAGSRGGY